MNGLLGFLQSASNTAANTVSGPVDLIAAGLRKVGVPVPEDPVAGANWMKHHGLLRDVPDGPAKVLGETAGMLTPALAMQYAPQIASVANKAISNAMAPTTANKELGAIVWHGSPHKFDRFDSSKIGTGEGAQAYGHGLYLAESPDVAKSYIPKTADGAAPTPDGLRQSIQTMRTRLADAEKNGGYSPAVMDRLRKTIADLESSDLSARAPSLYKVDLPDEAIAKMLDWDKPMSKQNAAVKKAWQESKKMLPPNALDDLGGDLSLMYGPNVRPQDFLNTWESLGQRAGGEAALQKAGIPGIRYLDANSRGAGSGTSNFVVFPGNESILSILERNSQALK